MVNEPIRLVPKKKTVFGDIRQQLIRREKFLTRLKQVPVVGKPTARGLGLISSPTLTGVLAGTSILIGSGGTAVLPRNRNSFGYSYNYRSFERVADPFP